MKFSVYSGQSCCVVVPEFLLPPAATARYEPLIHLGSVDESAIDPDQLQRIHDAIAQQFHALVDETSVGGWALVPSG